MTSHRMRYKIGLTEYNVAIKDIDASGNGGGVPLGTILPYSADSDTPPEGFSFCDGTAVSRSLYADLFALIGTSYGAGDGETTFNLPDLTDAAWLNGSYEKTAYETAGSYTFTATKPGWYKITIKGAGGGGGGGGSTTNHYSGGAGGGEGGTTFTFEKMAAGDIASITIGAGGAGATGNGTSGSNGENSIIVVNAQTYTAGGGGRGFFNSSTYYAGYGGSGTIPGAPGENGEVTSNTNVNGGSGGGNGGGTYSSDGTLGGGGGGARTSTKAGNGGDGYCWIEYIGTSQNFIIRTFDEATLSSAQIDLSQYTNALNNKADKADGVPVGTVLPFSGNGSLPAGYLLCDGSAVSRSMYEDLFGVIGTLYGEGDGVSTFNLPDLGFVDGLASMAPVYGNGHALGLKIGITDGGTASKPIVYHGNSIGLNYSTSTTSTGVGVNEKSNGESGVYADLSNAPEYSSNIHYIIKAFNGMNSHGALLDLTGMANEVNQKFDPRTDFCIIYPNGGTEANPANITTNSRYVEVNPFPGYDVRCQVELFYSNEWGYVDFGSYYSGGAFGNGVIAAQVGDENIIISTGNDHIIGTGNHSISPSTFASVATAVASAPCRVKVWKIGKI